MANIFSSFIFFCFILTASGLRNICRICVCLSNFTFNCSNQSIIYPHDIPQSATYLDLSFNNISSINATTFGTFKNLKFLNLSHNFISDLPYGLVSNSSFIETIDLSGNNFDSIGEKVFEGLTSLRNLHLNNLPLLTSIHPNAFSHLINLKYLSISNNTKLCSLNGTLASLSALNFLDVSSNSLRYISLNLNTLLQTSNFSHNAWVCDCHMKNNLITPNLTTHTSLNFSLFHEGHKYFLCDSPLYYKHLPVLYVFNLLQCATPNSSNGSVPPSNVSAISHTTSNLSELEKNMLLIEFGQNVTLNPGINFNEEDCLWTRDKDHYLSIKPHQVYIKNNTLTIIEASPDILGDYFLFCYKVSNHTWRQVYSLVHRSSLMHFVELYSVIVGLLSALSFFIFSLFYGSLRFVTWLSLFIEFEQFFFS